MTKDDFIFNLKRCGCLYKDGHTYYEENELIECFEDVGAFNKSSITPQESCSNCCNGNQIEKAKLCQKSYLAGIEHKQEPKIGHWEYFDPTYDGDIYKCSICKCAADVPTVLGIPMFKYCPNCGAKMESEE